MDRNLRRDIKIKKEVKKNEDSREAHKKKKPILKEYMQQRIATQMRADAAFIRSKK